MSSDTQAAGAAARIFITREKLRNTDTDQQGHVNNCSMAEFFEAGRVEIMNGPEIQTLRKGMNIVVVRLEIDFKRELFFPGEVEVQSHVTRAGNTSFSIGQRLLKDGEEYASGVSVCVLIDTGTRKPITIPAELRAYFGVAG